MENKNSDFIFSKNQEEIITNKGSSSSSDSSFDKSQKINWNPIKKRRTKTAKLSYGESEIRIGSEYQADIPEFIPESERTVQATGERALLVWKPGEKIPESILQQYITLANQEFGYNTEQALAMLFWHKYEIEKAVNDLKNYSPNFDDWTSEDKLIFEKAVMFHGKNFQRIRELLPDKTIGDVINQYYIWKKKGRCQQRQLRKRHR